MKKILCIVGVIMIITNLSGCSIYQKTNVRTEQLEKESQTEMERIYEVENTMIQALENRDEELLKSLFSEKALSRAGDLDKGIDYMFNLYQGEFVEVVERNHGTDEYIERGKHSKVLSVWCIIRTTTTEYKISWVDWVKQEEDESAKGIYCMQIVEYHEGVQSSYYDIAGIEYPQRNSNYIIIKAVNNMLDTKDITYLQAILSQTTLSYIKNIEVYEGKLWEIFPHYIYSDIDDGWVTYTEVDGKMRQNVFLEMQGDGENYIMYFCYDELEPDKISILKFTKVEEGVDLSNYELGDKYTEPGVYLP